MEFTVEWSHLCLLLPLPGCKWEEGWEWDDQSVSSEELCSRLPDPPLAQAPVGSRGVLHYSSVHQQRWTIHVPGSLRFTEECALLQCVVCLWITSEVFLHPFVMLLTDIWSFLSPVCSVEELNTTFESFSLLICLTTVNRKGSVPFQTQDPQNEFLLHDYLEHILIQTLLFWKPWNDYKKRRKLILNFSLKKIAFKHLGGLNLCGSSVCVAFLDVLNPVLCLKIPDSPGAVLEWHALWQWREGSHRRRSPGDLQVKGQASAGDPQGLSVQVVGWRLVWLQIWAPNLGKLPPRSM